MSSLKEVGPRPLFLSNQPRTPIIALHHLSDHHSEYLDVLDDPCVHRLLESVIGITHERSGRRLRALTLAAWALAISIRLRKLLLHSLIGCGQEDYFTVIVL